MAANSSCNNRKQPSSSSIFTRSKYQVQSSVNRSGCRRLLTPLQWSELPKGKPRGRYGHRSHLDESRISHIAIKDLRAHRVFSFCNPDTGESQIIEDGCGNPDGMASREEKMEEEFFSPDRNLGNSTESGRDDPNRVSLKENAGFCDEEIVQTTPPDAEILIKPDMGEGGGNGAQRVSRITENILRKQQGHNIRNNDSIPRSRLVLNRCSRLKLFKAPGSFSYRRLLPYLMDIAKDNSSASRNVQCPKLEIDLEEMSSPSVLAYDNEQMCKNKLSVDASQIRGNDNATLTHSDGSVNDKEPDLISSEPICEPQTAFDLQTKHELQIVKVISDESQKLEPLRDNLTMIQVIDQPEKPPCIVNHEALSKDEVVEEFFQQLSVDSEEDRVTPEIELITNVRSPDTVNLEQNLLGADSFAPLRFLDARQPKGILKRNPRGCRGLCTCLNCASFRVHAERAFEFSRNQMQDAEEVAVELMKELSYLRNMLKESALEANGHAFVHINQVKDACEKASNAEELAKERLKQMNYDLNIHCRITCLRRPRVSFSNYVNEQVIQRKDCKANNFEEQRK